jgi:hypothetical protein
MLHQPRADDVLLVGQRAHAFVSGQLARAWAEPFEPWEEVCLAALEHDTGWVEEDDMERPSGTSFLELPRERHIALWERAARLVLNQSRYAAVLVSMHGTRLYAGSDDPVVAAWLERERRWQQTAAAGFDPEQLERNSRLVATWDRLSLAVCSDPERWGPLAEPRVRRTGEDAFAVEPWPFRGTEVTVRYDGRLARSGAWLTVEASLRPG